jgi:hypothetical protein
VQSHRRKTFSEDHGAPFLLPSSQRQSDQKPETAPAPRRSPRDSEAVGSCHDFYLGRLPSGRFAGEAHQSVAAYSKREAGYAHVIAFARRRDCRREGPKLVALREHKPPASRTTCRLVVIASFPAKPTVSCTTQDR